MLSADEQVLVRQRDIFVGGCTLETAEGVMRSPTSSLIPSNLDGLQSFEDKSILAQTMANDGKPRFTMLETIREYASEQLMASGEATAVRHRSADDDVRMVESARAEPKKEYPRSRQSYTLRLAPNPVEPRMV